MTTIGGKPCLERNLAGERCSKNLGHHSDHRFPMAVVKPAGRTLAQALGKVMTCNVVLEVKDSAGVVKKHRCRKPAHHLSNHHDGGRTWA